MAREAIFATVGDVINVMGANRGPLRWRRTCDEDAYFGKLGPS